MNDDRLLEIVSTISMLDGPLVILGYLTSLKDYEMQYLFDCIKQFGYGDLNFYEAIQLFANDYLKDKKVDNNNKSFKDFGYSKGVYDDTLYFNAGYLEQLMQQNNAASSQKFSNKR